MKQISREKVMQAAVESGMDITKPWMEQSAETKSKFSEKLREAGLTPLRSTPSETTFNRKALLDLGAFRLLDHFQGDHLAAILYWENTTGQRCPYRTAKDFDKMVKRVVKLSKRFV